jgi:ferric-dicitrate binding protein FerR (iron transport regulator)
VSVSAIGLIEQMQKTRHDSATPSRLSRFRERQKRHREPMDDREAQTYSTPPEATPTAAETEAARESMSKGLPTLLASVFVAFVVVAVVVLLVRYAF